MTAELSRNPSTRILHMAKCMKAWIINFMFFTGDFEKVDGRMGQDDMRYLILVMPNRETRYSFCEKIMAWFN